MRQLHSVVFGKTTGNVQQEPIESSVLESCDGMHGSVNYTAFQKQLALSIVGCYSRYRSRSIRLFAIH